MEPECISSYQKENSYLLKYDGEIKKENRNYSIIPKKTSEHK